MEKWQGLFNTKFNWPIVVPCVLFWTCAWYFGLFYTTIWTVILAAVGGIYLRITGRV